MSTSVVDSEELVEIAAGMVQVMSSAASSVAIPNRALSQISRRRIVNDWTNASEHGVPLSSLHSSLIQDWSATVHAFGHGFTNTSRWNPADPFDMDSQLIKDRFEHARRLCAAEKFAEAVPYLRRTLETFPESTHARQDWQEMRQDVQLQLAKTLMEIRPISTDAEVLLSELGDITSYQYHDEALHLLVHVQMELYPDDYTRAKRSCMRAIRARRTVFGQRHEQTIESINLMIELCIATEDGDTAIWQRMLIDSQRSTKSPMWLKSGPRSDLDIQARIDVLTSEHQETISRLKEEALRKQQRLEADNADMRSSLADLKQRFETLQQQQDKDSTALPGNRNEEIQALQQEVMHLKSCEHESTRATLQAEKEVGRLTDLAQSLQVQLDAERSRSMEQRGNLLNKHREELLEVEHVHNAKMATMTEEIGRLMELVNQKSAHLETEKRRFEHEKERSLTEWQDKLSRAAVAHTHEENELKNEILRLNALVVKRSVPSDLGMSYALKEKSSNALTKRHSSAVAPEVSVQQRQGVPAPHNKVFDSQGKSPRYTPQRHKSENFLKTFRHSLQSRMSMNHKSETSFSQQAVVAGLNTIREEEVQSATKSVDHVSSIEQSSLPTLTDSQNEAKWNAIEWFDSFNAFECLIANVDVGSLDVLMEDVQNDKDSAHGIAKFWIGERHPPFETTSSHTASYARTKHSTNRYVVKTTKNQAHDEASLSRLLEKIHAEALAKAFAFEFNSLVEQEFSLDFLVSSCLQRLNKEGNDLPNKHSILETFIAGDYVKYNSNRGYVNQKLQDDPTNNAIQAFSHFTFERSQGRFLINNLGGVGRLLFHPAVQARERNQFVLLDSNYGAKGFRTFFATHDCNAVCRDLQLRSDKAMFESTTFVYRTSWQSRRTVVCCSNKLCAKIMDIGNSQDSGTWPGTHWCHECFPQLDATMTTITCKNAPSQHDFRISAFFYESQGVMISAITSCKLHTAKGEAMAYV